MLVVKQRYDRFDLRQLGYDTAQVKFFPAAQTKQRKLLMSQGDRANQRNRPDIGAHTRRIM